jgi:hypothetical protein
MTEIARELDSKLQTYDAATAHAVENLIRAILQLAELQSRPENSASIAAHRAHIARFAGIWANDDFERPRQVPEEN